MKPHIMEKFTIACDMIYDWYFNDNVCQSECMNYCENNHLNYDFIANFVWKYQDEYAETFSSWKDIYNKHYKRC